MILFILEGRRFEGPTFIYFHLKKFISSPRTKFASVNHIGMVLFHIPRIQLLMSIRSDIYNNHLLNKPKPGSFFLNDKFL